MRVVGGVLRGRKLATPATRAIRPTSDRIRESIFDLMGMNFSCSLVLDLFAGTGALGIEALSRGCESAVFVERDKAGQALIHNNLERCGLADRCRVVGCDAIGFLKNPNPGQAADLVLLDPPYRKGMVPLALDLLDRGAWVVDGGLLVCETESNLELQAESGGLSRVKHRIYGDTAVTLFRRAC